MEAQNLHQEMMSRPSLDVLSPPDEHLVASLLEWEQWGSMDIKHF